MIPETDLAYLAGVIDSDGFISVKRDTYQIRKGSATYPTFYERVGIKQVYPQAIDLLFDLFAGYRFAENPSLANGKPLLGWQATNLKAFVFLTAIRPYLRIKRAQADNCFALRSLIEESKVHRIGKGRGQVGSIVRTEELNERMERLYEEALRLNAMGTTGKRMSRVRK